MTPVSPAALVRGRAGLWPLVGLASLIALTSTPAAAFHDGGPSSTDVITINSPAALSATRTNLINKIWGVNNGQLPTRMAYYQGSATPITQVALPPMSHTDELGILSPCFGQCKNSLCNNQGCTQIPGSPVGSVSGVAYLFVPQSSQGNRVAIVHFGHNPPPTGGWDDQTFDDSWHGYAQMVAQLLWDGYTVAAISMPGMGPIDYAQDIGDNIGQGFACGHFFSDSLYTDPNKPAMGLRFYLDPTLQVINYLMNMYPNTKEIDMTGLSGGGWTTTVYPALDTRITVSAPVAGSEAFTTQTGRDPEQMLTGLDGLIGGYQDLYLMAAAGTSTVGAMPRRVLKVLNRSDDCCFGQNGYNNANNNNGGLTWTAANRQAEINVRTQLAALGLQGSYRFEINDSTTTHSFSQYTVNLIADEFEGASSPIAAVVQGGGDGQSLVARNTNGNLFSHDGSGWHDSGLAMVGTPAVTIAPNACDAYAVFYRDADNFLNYGFASGGTVHYWRTLPGPRLIGDPAATSWTADRYDVYGVTAPNMAGDQQLTHWYSTNCGSNWTYEVVAGSTGSCVAVSHCTNTGFQPTGTPAVVSTSSGVKGVFYKAKADATGKVTNDLKYYDVAAQSISTIAGRFRGEPSAIAYNSLTAGAYVLGLDYNLWQLWGGSGSFTAFNLSAMTGAIPLLGSPSASIDSFQQIRVWTKTRDQSNVAGFFWPNGNWSFGDHGGTIQGSPVVQGSAVSFLLGLDNGVWTNSGGSGFGNLGGAVNK